MNKHKYLNDLGIKTSDLPWNMLSKDKRSEKWRKERLKYGFDERETWNLDHTLTLLAYERLKMYYKIASTFIVMDDPQSMFDFEGRKVLLDDAVKEILSAFEKYLANEDAKISPKHQIIYEEYTKAWALLALILPVLWW